VSRAVARLRALVAELSQVIAELEQEPVAKPRKRPLVKVDREPSPDAVEAMERRLRRLGVAR
jgi:hypothetical protein